MRRFLTLTAITLSSLIAGPGLAGPGLAGPGLGPAAKVTVITLRQHEGSASVRVGLHQRLDLAQPLGPREMKQAKALQSRYAKERRAIERKFTVAERKLDRLEVTKRVSPIQVRNARLTVRKLQAQLASLDGRFVASLARLMSPAQLRRFLALTQSVVTVQHTPHCRDAVRTRQSPRSHGGADVGDAKTVEGGVVGAVHCARGVGVVGAGVRAGGRRACFDARVVAESAAPGVVG